MGVGLCNVVAGIDVFVVDAGGAVCGKRCGSVGACVHRAGGLGRAGLER